MSFVYLLRVPLIFILDELFKSSFGLPDFVNLMFPGNNTLNQIEIVESTQYYKAFMKIIVSCLVFFSSLWLMFIHEKYLKPVYLYVLSVGVVLISYWENIQTVGFFSEEYKKSKIEMANKLITWDADGYIIIFIQFYPRLYKLFYSLILQYFLSLIFDVLQFLTTNYSIHKVFRYSFIIPTLIASIPNTRRILNTVTILSTLLQLFILLKILFLNIFTIANLIRNEYNQVQMAINDPRILDLLKSKWYNLKISNVFRIFWVIQILNQVLNLPTNTEINNLTLFEVVKYLLIKGCDTYTAVLGMASIVCYFLNNITRAIFQWVLLDDEVDDLDYRKYSAIFFVILAMQFGLTSLDPENRWIKLLEIIHLVSFGFQNYIFDIVGGLLLTHLNGSDSRSLNKHSRALIVSGLIIVVGVTTIYYLWSSYHSVSPGLLSVYVTSISIILKVLLSLAVYSLLLINSNSSIFWENIDDFGFYIDLLGTIVLEYCLGYFLLLNDIYNLVFVSGGVIFAIVICYQILQKVVNERHNWRIFMKHYAVRKKINSLPDATSIQLSELDDVCAICYQKMKSAKITKCNHFFHGKCLREWIYIQDQCPLCKSN